MSDTNTKIKISPESHLVNRLPQLSPRQEIDAPINNPKQSIPEQSELDLALEKSDSKLLHQAVEYPKNQNSNFNSRSQQGLDYVKAFIDNPMVKKVFPDIMNWLNITGNVFSLSAYLLGLSDSTKKIAKGLGSFTTKSFMVSTSVINIVERLYSRNLLSALGFFNDILIAGLIGQDDTYLARGTASGTYNMANSLADSIKRESFNSIEDYCSSIFQAYKKFFGNLFSKNIIRNFMDHRNSMWAIFGGIFSNVGALSWMLTGKIKVPTFIRDVAGVMMDIEQLNPGHLNAGKRNYFFSGVTLAVGTVCDLLTRLLPNYKDALVPLTFIFDGIGRHLLRLHRNETELKSTKTQAIDLALAGGLA